MNLADFQFLQISQTFEALQYFHFLRPYWLLMIIPVIFMLKTLVKNQDSVAMWREKMSPEIFKTLIVEDKHYAWVSPKTFSLLLIFILAVISAGPSWQKRPSAFSEDQSALIIALDVSKTMNQSDVQPTRLLRAKKKILELLALRGDAKTALIVFSGSAFTVMPISQDKEMIEHFLDALDGSLMPKSGKNTQAILPLSQFLLTSTEVQGSILLITDGISNTAIESFSEFFKIQSHQLIIWAMGDRALVRQEILNSNVIAMQLESLKKLNNETHGRLILMSHNNEDVERINSSIKSHLLMSDDELYPWTDEGYPLVFLVAFIYLFWFRKGWTLQW